MEFPAGCSELDAAAEMIKQSQRWKAHKCESCDRWRSDGTMVSAGIGKKCHSKFLCRECLADGRNLRAVRCALLAWEIERGYQAAHGNDA